MRIITVKCIRVAYQSLKHQSPLQQTTFINTFSLFFFFFSEKIRLDVSSESSAARQRIHTKNQALFSLKDKSKKNKMSSAAIFVGTLRVKMALLR